MTVAEFYFDQDADLSLIQAKKVAVIGFGSQGHAHALNLKDSGVDVVVALPAGSATRAKAEERGLSVLTAAEATKWADLIMVLAPDTKQRDIYKNEIAPNLSAGKAIAFGHGFAVRFGLIEPPADVDVFLVAPKGPGNVVRSEYEAGRGVANLIAIHQDATGNAWELALSYSKAIGGTKIGVLKTTFKEETETDLFGEQAVLCGGANQLVQYGFETLVEAGYQPEVAYFEVLHELKLVVDLMHTRGIAMERKEISDTAEYGDYVSGPRVIGPEVKEHMKEVLADIQNGNFAKRFIADQDAGAPEFTALREKGAKHPVEAVGIAMRKMFGWAKKD